MDKISTYKLLADVAVGTGATVFTLGNAQALVGILVGMLTATYMAIKIYQALRKK